MRVLQNRIVLVTGGAGFIGSHLIEELLERKAQVISFDNFSQGSINNLNNFKNNPKLHSYKGNVNNLKQLEKVFKNHNIDYVFHYAATVGVKRTMENPLAVLEDIQGIDNILTLSKKYNIKKLMYASSSEVYGEPISLPEKEDGILNAHLPYAQVKLIGESYCKAYTDHFKLPTTSLRFFNVFGPRQGSSEYGFVVGIFMKQAVEGKSLTVVRDGSMTRNFVYVKDNVLASIEALLTEKTDGESINIGTGKAISVKELAKKIIKISGKKISIASIPARSNHEILHREPDLRKYRKLVSVKPRYSLEKGLQETYAWYKQAEV